MKFTPRTTRNFSRLLLGLLGTFVATMTVRSFQIAKEPSDFTLTYYRLHPRSGAPPNPIDPYDCFQKDADGQLIIEPSLTYECADHPNEHFNLFLLKTRKGNSIIVEELSPVRRPEYKSNCYGFVFLGGEYHVQAAEVEKILVDDDWIIISPEDVQPRDVGIYRDKSGTMIHTVVVEGRDRAGKILVNSKSGYAQVEKGLDAERAGVTREQLSKITVVNP